MLEFQVTSSKNATYSEILIEVAGVPEGASAFAVDSQFSITATERNPSIYINITTSSKIMMGRYVNSTSFNF